MNKLRSVLLSWPFLVLVVYAVLGVTFVGLSYMASAGGVYALLAVSAAVALFLGVAVGVIWVLALEEDWWNEFRETNAALAIAAVCQFLLLPGAWFLGGSLR